MKATLIAAALALPLSTLACASSDDAHEADNDIVGGVDANGAALAAVNTVSSYDGAGKYKGGCTGTLVAPTIVLTAKHCVVTEDENGHLTTTTWLDAGGKIQFALGTGHAPATRVVTAKSVTTCKLNEGGSAGIGCDVAILRLAEPITELAPLAISPTPLTPAQIGTRFTTVGFGTQDAANHLVNGKKMATETLRAITGRGLAATYPSYEAFAAILASVEDPEWMATKDADLRDTYGQSLLEGYEAQVGGGIDEAQMCHGDSGSPLLANIDGRLVIYGVLSTGVGGQKVVCARTGSKYATFGPEARALLDEAMSAGP